MMSLIQPMIELVNQIPYGHVLSYGKIAEQLNTITNETTSGWIVGRLLSSMPESKWSQLSRQRVVNKQGYISSLKLGTKGLRQIELLRQEGVEVNSEGYIDMVKYEWSFPKDDLFS